MFFAIQVTPSLFPAFRSGNRKTSLQGLISLNNLGFPNKRKVLCQDFSYQFTEVGPACALVQDIRRDSFKTFDDLGWKKCLKK
jgi:hypothetical protein